MCDWAGGACRAGGAIGGKGGGWGERVYRDRCEGGALHARGGKCGGGGGGGGDRGCCGRGDGGGGASAGDSLGAAGGSGLRGGLGLWGQAGKPALKRHFPTGDARYEADVTHPLRGLCELFLILYRLP